MSFSYGQPGDPVKMEDFTVINYLRCDKCGRDANLYYYRPVVDMWVCAKCKARAHRWEMEELRKMIEYEN